MSQPQHAPAVHAIDDGQHAHDSHGIAKYLYVFAALCVLTLMSFWTYADFPVKWPFHDQPKVGWAFMMAVSTCKALLVILFFMHVKYEANWKYVLTIPAAMMSIFLILMLVPDVGNRNRSASPEVKMLQPVPSEHQHSPGPGDSGEGHRK